MDNLKNILIIATVAAVLVIAFISTVKKGKGGCCGGNKPYRKKIKKSELSGYPYKSVIYIDGMTCENCAARLENAFNKNADTVARVNLGKKYAEVWTMEEMAEEKVRETVEKSGFLVVEIYN